MTITAATKRKIARNPCASTSVTISTVLAVIFYLGSRAGLDLPLWLGSLITGVIVSASLAFSARGVVGVWMFLLYGSGGPDEKEGDA